jgi:hypothetical protein
MVLKVFGVPVSQPVRAIIMALEMHNTPYELVSTMPGKKTVGGSKQYERQLFTLPTQTNTSLSLLSLFPFSS